MSHKSVPIFLAVSSLLLCFAASCTPPVTATSFTLSYNANSADSGTIPAATTASAGTSLTVAGNSGGLVRSGYSFSGWNTASDGSGTTYAAGATIVLNASAVLYARWTNTVPAGPTTLYARGIVDLGYANRCYVYLVWTDNADNESGVEIQYGSDAGGWTALATTTEPVSYYVDKTIPHGATRNYRVRTVNPNGSSSWAVATTAYDANWSTAVYQVTFSPNGAAGSDYTQGCFGSTAITLKANEFERSGYMFRGWATSAGGPVAYKDGASFTTAANVTLYAVWLLETDSSYFIYTVSFKEATLIRYTGSDKAVVVPHLLGGYPVTSIYSAPDLSSGAFAFSSVTSVILPATIKSIGDSTFEMCKSLVTVEIPDSLTTVGEAAFADCVVLSSITLPETVTEIGKYAFYECKALTSFTFPKGITVLNEGLFCRCSYLASVTLPGALETIGDAVFYQCPSLTSISLPSTITFIDEEAFFQCTGLTAIILPESLTSIERYTFYNCTSLSTITIPASVSAIGNYAFYKCTSLTSVFVNATTPPSLSGTWTFDSNGAGRRIYVPASSETDYEQATYWSEYAASIYPQK